MRRLALILLFVVSDFCFAATYYVDGARPDDTGNGQSWATAKQTIAAGVALLSSGDTLKIKTGSYSEAISVKNKSWAATTTIETDDGAGNAGSVTLSGSATGANGVSTVIDVDDSQNVLIDGRQAEGFTLNASSASHDNAIHVADTGSDNEVRYVKVTGTTSAAGAWAESAILMYGITDGIFDNIIIDITSNNHDYSIKHEFGAMTSSASIIRNVEMINSGTGGGCGEGMVSFKSVDGGSIYNNFVKGDSCDSQIWLRNSNNNDIYNNVLWVQSGVTVLSAFQLRAGGGETEVDNNRVFNNTIILDGSNWYSIPFLLADSASNNLVFNNLFVGSDSYFFGAFSTDGSSNESYHNRTTGTLTSWYENASVENMFGGGQHGNNLGTGEGTAFLTLSGDRPSPYWTLSEDPPFDGYSIGAPATDYDGNSRGTPPDVGAFEYTVGAGPDPLSLPFPPRAGANWMPGALLVPR